MSGQFRHSGVLGMRWGRRKNSTKKGKANLTKEQRREETIRRVAALALLGVSYGMMLNSAKFKNNYSTVKKLTSGPLIIEGKWRDTF